MTYAVQQDLVDRFGETEIIQLSDRENTGAINAAVVAQALGDADETIDSYVGKAARLPLATIPPVLTRLACDLARYYLYDDSAPEQIAKRHDAALALLKDIAANRVTLGLDTAAEQAAATSHAPAYEAPERIFTQDSLRDY